MARVRERSRVARLRKSVKGISPTIAALLMIAIAVVAALVAYMWIMGFLGFNTAKAGKAIQIQSVMYTGSHLVVYVQNVGQSAVSFTPSQTLYVDGLLRGNATVNPTKLEQTKTTSIVDTAALSLNQKVKLKVVTNDGTWIEAYFTAYTFTGDYTLTVLVNGNGHVDLVPQGQAYYYETVQLTAVNDTHWTFGDPLWSGDLSGNTNPQQILMDGNKAVTATFVPIAHQITFAQTGIGSDFTGNVVMIDGTNYTLPQTFTWNEGDTHGFGFGSPLTVGTDKQYVWNSTTGDSTLQSDNFVVPDLDATITGNYKTQYYLTVSSPFGTPGGAEWYDAGATAYASLNTDTADHGNQTRHVFANWGVDATGTSYAQSDGITMDGPRTALANWKIQYQVAFNVDPSGYGTTTPSGTDWYDEGPPGVSISALVVLPRYKFSYWDTAGGNVNFADSASASTIATVSGPDTITANFAMNTVDITITSYPTSNPDSPFFVKVDNETVTTPYTISWTIGSTHDLEALSPVSGTTGTQHVFTGWSDLGDQIHVYTVPDSGETVTANYKTQYNLSMSADSGTVSPDSGWYDDGSQVTISASPPSAGADEQYVWNGWTGSGSGSYTGTDNPATNAVTMSGPVTETASWTHQYKLTMAASSGTTSPPIGDHWYDAGSTVTISATAPSAGAGEQYVWNGWTGIGTISYTGTDNPATNAVTMSGPVTETASWSHEFRLTMATNLGTTTPAVGDTWYPDGSKVTIQAFASSAGAGERYVWNGWTGTGAISYSGTDNPATDAVTMNSPITETASWTHQYLLTVVTDPAGLSPQPSRNPAGEAGPANGWWFDASTSVELTAQTVTGHTFSYWDVDTVSQGNGVNPISVGMSAAHTATAHYVTGGLSSSMDWMTFTSTVTLGNDETMVGILWDTRFDWAWGSLIFDFMDGKQVTFVLTAPNGTVLTMTNTTIYAFYHGVFTYVFKPDAVGTWSAYARFDGDSTYSPSSTPPPPRTFTVVNPVSITITSSPTTGSGFITINGTAHNTPYIHTWNQGDVLQLQALDKTAGGTRYVWLSWSDGGARTHDYVVPSSTQAVTANYQTQYQVTFGQSGASSDATGTVLTVGTSTYTYAQLPQTNIWVDAGATFSYTGTVPAGTGKQYVLTDVSGGLTSPIGSSGTATGNYKTQYQVTYDVYPTGSGSTNPSGTNVWEDTSRSINATANSGYAFSYWSSDTGSITFASPTSPSTTATIGGTGTITANFGTIATETLYPTSVTPTDGLPVGDPLGNMQSDNGVYYRVGSTTGLFNNLEYYCEFTAAASAGKTRTQLTVTLNGYYSRAKTQTLYIYNFATSQWVQMDQYGMTANTEATRTFTITSNIGNYVNAQNRIRVRIDTNGGMLASYTHYNDYFKIDVVYVS